MNDLKAALDARLRDMDWHGERELLERVRARAASAKAQYAYARAPRRALLIACAICLMLCSAAVALTAQYINRQALYNQARGAVSARYGLTGDMLMLFNIKETREGGERAIVFTPFAFDVGAIGVYTVIPRADGAVLASWTHDGEEIPDTDDLSADVWGPKQLNKLIALRRAHDEAWSDAALANYDALSLEQRALIDAPLIEYPEAFSILNIAPDSSDISPEDAIKRAKAAILSKYGADADAFGARVSFQLTTRTGAREYVIFLTSDIESAGYYQVRVASPSGDIALCAWWISAEYRTPPEGDLRDYASAAREYARSGAFEIAPAREKARVAARFIEAGLGALLPEGDYISPDTLTDISEADARARAAEALTAEYGVRAGDITRYFGANATLLNQEGARVWRVVFTPKIQPNWRWREYVKLGEYTVCLSAANGEVIECLWSLEGANGAQIYARDTFGAANAYSADMLPWISDLLGALDDILAHYPQSVNKEDMSIEHACAYDALMRAAGYEPEEYNAAAPSDTDVERARAIELARAYAAAAFGLNADKLNECELIVTCETEYNAFETPVKCWNVSIHNYDADIYRVTIAAASGELLMIYRDISSLGEG